MLAEAPAIKTQVDEKPRHPRGEGEAIDTPRAFLGENATYYDEKWRWMDWRGARTSWNAAAAGAFGFWLAYRRMYGLASIQLGWLAVLVLMYAVGFPWFVPLVLHALVAWQFGRFANWIYYQHFIHTAQKVYKRYTGPDERERQLRAAGGINTTAPAVLAALSLAIVVGGYVLFGDGGLFNLSGTVPEATEAVERAIEG
ncbi:DUF2628 domain-containing protein [Marinivivus vitaminiproducens]|uniref:DUF2628 domain-containing protein n=1 Tax=Marinivivus vitaminiproducens TaxID=3035935 RepID=UPI0027A1BDD6|nr:DUF2628 domain-containing protein [Geminicoccaceae bacterium SCSIO 64248]